MTEAILDTTHVRRWKRHTDVEQIRHEWLSTIPRSWEKKRLSFLFDQMGSGTTPSTSDRRYYEDGTIPWVNTGDLNDTLIGDVQKSVNEVAIRDHPALKVYPVGTLLVALYGATIGKVGILQEPSTVNQACFAMAKPRDVAPTFLLYWLIGNREHIVAMAYGGGQPNISGEMIRSLRVGVPPLAEQRAIAAFLDRETGRIDALIGQKERLIDLLEEKRQAVISHAVTRGLDPNAKMKDSGVPWLAEIPEHWNRMRVKHLLNKIEQGWSPDAENREAGPDEWAVMRAGCVNSGSFDEKDHKALPFGLEPDESLEIKPGDLLMSRACGSAELVGSVGLVQTCRRFLMLCDKLFRLLVNKERVSSEYLELALKARSARDQIEQNLGGAEGLARNIGQGVIKEMIVCVPPLTEQDAIVEHIARSTSTINDAVCRCRDGIERLQEYRTALISAAVTGQIDVRDEVPEL